VKREEDCGRLWKIVERRKMDEREEKVKKEKVKQEER
jgi:hypothetical protein